MLHCDIFFFLVNVSTFNTWLLLVALSACPTRPVATVNMSSRRLAGSLWCCRCPWGHLAKVEIIASRLESPWLVCSQSKDIGVKKKGETLNPYYLPFNNQRKKPYENLKKRWNSNKTNIKRCGRIDLNVIWLNHPAPDSAHPRSFSTTDEDLALETDRKPAGWKWSRSVSNGQFHKRHGVYHQVGTISNIQKYVADSQPELKNDGMEESNFFICNCLEWNKNDHPHPTRTGSPRPPNLQRQLSSAKPWFSNINGLVSMISGD